MTSLKQLFREREIDNEGTLWIVDAEQAVDEVVEKIHQLIKDAEDAIEDFKIDGNSNLDSAIQFYSCKIIAFKEALKLLGSEKGEKEKQK